MIVRINQFDAPAAEAVAGWADAGPAGKLRYAWPATAVAFQLQALEQDETWQTVSIRDRQQRIRGLIPTVIEALHTPDGDGDRVVVRLDGPMTPTGLAGVYPRLADPACTERWSISAAACWGPGEPAPQTGVRLVPADASAMTALCTDADIGLEHDARLRVFAVPEVFVNPLLDAADTDDERWRELLPAAAFVLSTARGLNGLVVVSERLPAGVVSERLMRGLKTIP